VLLVPLETTVDYCWLGPLADASTSLLLAESRRAMVPLSKTVTVVLHAIQVLQEVLPLLGKSDPVIKTDIRNLFFSLS
jgi:hypothetical protein